MIRVTFSKNRASLRCNLSENNVTINCQRHNSKQLIIVLITERVDYDENTVARRLAAYSDLITPSL